MIYLVREYIKYCLIAKNRHGVHSPYVYDFNDRCLSTSIPKEHQRQFKALKNSLLNDQSTIQVTDLGAGSKKMEKDRKVAQIAKISGSRSKYAKLLYRLVRHYQPQKVLELGTSLGLGSYMLASATDEVVLTTVEGCQSTMGVAMKAFPESVKHKVDFIHSDFLSFLKQLKKDQVYDLVFIDGDHKGEKLVEQLDLLKPHIHDETIILIDDIRWSKDMLSTWNSLLQSEKYHLSIDLFKMGIIVPRFHQEKEHFVIRY
ncbi:O-methyltransferase [Brumimicrobium aurantiacum]|uniref:Class I SAM-dependent methyltransferase n=1 Tax=Brumimicrobium aurantiacum TaxID=1737063 RepID=A0A3E1EVK4_9FLAO|nr:class I SAM-dependent methyltransferase [Brumimicrobium aurantiacum]RFC53523.1 class I SAM-dependent methyltransferase [Brumimicrobium aurantiacum]